MKGMNFGLKVIICCIIAVVLWYAALIGFAGDRVAQNITNGWYWVGLLICVGVFGWFCKSAIAEDDGPNTAPRAVLIIVTVIVLLWSGGWLAGAGEKVGPSTPKVEGVK